MHLTVAGNCVSAAVPSTRKLKLKLQTCFNIDESQFSEEVHCHPTHHVPHIYLGTLIDDAPTEAISKTPFTGYEHLGTIGDELTGQPELNESSTGGGYGDDEEGGPNSAASLV